MFTVAIPGVAYGAMALSMSDGRLPGLRLLFLVIAVVMAVAFVSFLVDDIFRWKKAKKVPGHELAR